ncbi:G2/M phase-specific E3 ubiquitin-protein ligase-like isoform X1 [Oryzias latipes]|uniref:G2/M phase-specific E3 ubiquitin-protein ligase-like isoform X1 n=1 Tax=Oryzias latipes TaxID=8090 RepID=UPI000CE19BA7|nr:G2/M phase-specific E3 ubiquitin-protein ligase-like isoform X1 [Oryzias latipes]
MDLLCCCIRMAQRLLTSLGHNVPLPLRLISMKLAGRIKGSLSTSALRTLKKPWEPQHESSPFSNVTEAENNQVEVADEVQQVTEFVENRSNPGTSRCLTIQNSCCINYTSLFEPILIEDDDHDEDLTQNNKKDQLLEEPVDTNMQAHEIIAQLAMAINHKKVSRFNICRLDVWDGAVRGFRRNTYSDNNDLFIKFTDDAGCFEEGLDTGGPRRGFLTLLMNHLRTRPIFDGPQESRYIVYNSKAAREDEYFLAGKMVAVSIVHGGPAPHFLSKNLVNHTLGNPSFNATVEDVKDEEIGKVLREVLETESDESLQSIILQNSTMFQTAGCLWVVRTCEKQAFVEEYLRWYIIDRNHSSIQRFRDGLASLGFFTALQQHYSVLAPVLCFSCKALTASDMENMFTPDLSPPGSTRRQKEAKTLGFWADFLADSEEKLTVVSLEELLMFATGLAAVPPAGMMPTPRIQFITESPFPVANTCANILKLPLVDTYSIFKENMDFGIQNAPGFGCF